MTIHSLCACTVSGHIGVRFPENKNDLFVHISHTQSLRCVHSIPHSSKHMGKHFCASQSNQKVIFYCVPL